MRIPPARAPLNYKHLFPTYRARYLFVQGALLRILEGDRAARALNVGTGEGEVDRLVAGYVERLDSCDINEADVATARNLNSDLPHVHYGIADGSALDHPDDSFELVLCLEVIEHTDDPQALLAELCRVLKPNGTLLLTCPSHHFPLTYDPLNRLLRPFGGRLPIGAYGYGHTWLVQHAEFEAWAASHGLAILETHRLSRHLAGLAECYVPGLMQRLLKPNAANREATAAAAFKLKPTTEEPPFQRWTDAFVRVDERLFARSRSSVGLGYVLRPL